MTVDWSVTRQVSTAGSCCCFHFLSLCRMMNGGPIIFKYTGGALCVCYFVGMELAVGVRMLGREDLLSTVRIVLYAQSVS
jgi:hypothetical protein